MLKNNKGAVLVIVILFLLWKKFKNSSTGENSPNSSNGSSVLDTLTSVSSNVKEPIDQILDAVEETLTQSNHEHEEIKKESC